jgi:hypothetical protein
MTAPDMSTYTRWTCLLPALLILMASGGCRHYNDEPKTTAVSVQGDYVAYGDLGGGATNILLEITGPDSADRYAGAIRYRSSIIHFSSIGTDSSGDTLRLEYIRDLVTYRAWTVPTAASLLLHFTTPTGLAALLANKELNGTNMTGRWTGAMSSINSLQQRTATLTMNQTGQLFSGSATVTFYQTAQFQFSTGAVSGSTFQLNGTMRVGTTDYSAQFTGNYLTMDSIGGNWYAGQNGADDNGYFAFSRPFE